MYRPSTVVIIILTNMIRLENFNNKTYISLEF